jgi:DNA-directed RNA polymerase specialized sigma subunit
MISAKLVGKSLNTVSDDLLADVYESGMTLEEIAKQLGVSKNAIAYRLRKVNTKMRSAGRPSTKEE